MNVRTLSIVWQPIVVLAFACVLALQIPRRALFFKPVRTPEVQPFASFVFYAPEAYGKLMQKVRMSWQVRTPIDADENLVEPMPWSELPAPPAPLAVDTRFLTQTGAAPSAKPVRPALLPPSLAAPALTPLPRTRANDDPALVRTTRDLADELLQIPDSLAEQVPHRPTPFALETPFQNPIPPRK